MNPTHPGQATYRPGLSGVFPPSQFTPQFTTHAVPHFPAPVFQKLQPMPVYFVDQRGYHHQPLDLKSCYEAIRASVSRVILDDHWNAPDLRTGIASSDCELAAIIVRCGKHVEVELKLM